VSEQPPDKQFFRIWGDDEGNIWVNGDLKFSSAQTGIRRLNIGRIVPPVPKPGEELWDDCLKLSRVKRLHLTVEEVDGGICLEDAVDVMNVCEDVHIEVGTLYAGKNFCATIKGGSKRVNLVIHKQMTHGGETDYDFGNRAPQQGHVNTVDCSVHVVSSPKKFRVRCLQAKHVRAYGNYKFDLPWPKPSWLHGAVVGFLRLVKVL